MLQNQKIDCNKQLEHLLSFIMIEGFESPRWFIIYHCLSLSRPSVPLILADLVVSWCHLQSCCSFTLREPEIKIQTSIGVAIGISMGFSLVYACVCFFVIVVRMRLISGEWTSAKDLVLHNEPASMFNPTDNSVSYPPGSNPQHFTKRHGSVITSSSSLETGSDPALATHEVWRNFWSFLSFSFCADLIQFHCTLMLTWTLSIHEFHKN